MKKHYLLNENGEIVGTSKFRQDEDWILLDECPFEYGIYDGEKWIENIAEKAKKELNETDKDMFHVIDDIIEYILNETPIPQEAIDKINNRKSLRDKI